jgi:putative transposase
MPNWAKTAELCRTHGMSEATIYTGRAKIGGMHVPDAKRLKQLQHENVRLQRLLAVSLPDLAALKDMLSRKM